ncbi:hypothetical protein CBS101457_004595 [Exobasidium rhododendri]|nr:hypothetical protein CBS101457_004595 [Exobasidium rhododendri]
MSSLLSPFNFGQKHAYFHVRITIHELVNVPLVTGRFKARWRVKNIHGLQNIPGALSAFVGEGSADKDANQSTENVDKKSLKHKKSFSSIASQEAGAVEDGAEVTSPASLHFPEADQESQQERKTSSRFISGFKDAFQGRSRKTSASIATRKMGKGRAGDSQPAEEEQDDEHKGDRGDGYGSRKFKEARHHQPKELSEDLSSLAETPKRTASGKSLAAVSDDTAAKRRSINGKARDEKDATYVSPSQMSHLLLQPEPRGETLNEKVRDHAVKWERQLEVGVRIPVERQRLNEKGSSNATASGALSPGGVDGGHQNPPSSATSARSSFSNTRVDGSSGLRGHQSHRNLAEERANVDGESREVRVEREGRQRDRDKELADAWGMLGNAELRIIIKGQVPTDTSGHHHSDTPFNLGNVQLNLAEFAPYPESHQHHHHHLHLHHQHHQHHHPQPNASTNGGKTSHLPALSRSETRRFLLNDSRTNATLKLTIEMSHVGGTREYAVPAVRRGLVVGGIATLMDGTPTRQGPGSSSNSEAGGSAEGGQVPSGDDHQHQHSSPQDLKTTWPPHSIAKYSRIPVSNLKTELSHQDATRAIKEAGGHRTGFSFAAGAHHERPPEDVIEALFSSEPGSDALSMLTPTVSRTEKVKGIAPAWRTKGGEGKDSGKGRWDSTDNGVYSEKPSLYDGISPADHPTDSVGRRLSRLPPLGSATECKPGPDLQRSSFSSSAAGVEEEKSNKSSTDAREEKKIKKGGHNRDSSTSTVRSILTNSLTNKVIHPFGGHSHEHSSNATSGNSNNSGSSNRTNNNHKVESSPSTSSHRPSLVHWDSSVALKENNPPDAKLGEPLIAPSHQLTSSPSLLSQARDNFDFDQGASTSNGSKDDGAKMSATRTDKTSSLSTNETKSKTIAFNPPDTPPDIARKEAFTALDGRKIFEEAQRASYRDRASKAFKGLTTEEAIQQGYRGAGWGTLDLEYLSTSSSLLKQSDAEDYQSSAFSSNTVTPTTSMLI